MMPLSPIPCEWELRRTAGTFLVLGIGLLAVCVCLLGELPPATLAATILGTLLAVSFDGAVGSYLLVLVCFHAIVSYLGFAAFGPSGVPPENNVAGYILESFSIFVLGISCAIAAYGLVRLPKLHWKQLPLDLNRLDSVALIAAGVGTVIVLFVIWRVGFIEMVLTGTFVRYFGEEQAGPDFVFYQSLMRRGLAILAGSVPVLLVRWQATRSKPMLLVAMVSLLAISATTRRGSLAMVLLAVIVTNAVLGKHRKAILIVTLVMAVAFLGLQSLFVPLLTDSTNPFVNVAAIVATLMTEVNDFSWVLSEWNHHLFYGATYAAAVWPIPSSFSHLKDAYVLSALTKDITGIPREAEHGGLRILIFGEAFLNFGYLGVIGVGVLFGILLRLANAAFAWARTGGAPIVVAVTSLFILFCMQMYVSGTAVLADVMLTAVTMIGIYVVSTRRGRTTMGGA